MKQATCSMKTIPDEQATWSVAYSDELSNSDVANPEHFLTAYQNQQAAQ